MSDFIRDPSTNRSIGEFMPIYEAIRAYYNKPDVLKTLKIPVETAIMKHMEEFGINQYPQKMNMVTHLRFEHEYVKRNG